MVCRCIGFICLWLMCSWQLLSISTLAQAAPSLSGFPFDELSHDLMSRLDHASPFGLPSTMSFSPAFPGETEAQMVRRLTLAQDTYVAEYKQLQQQRQEQEQIVDRRQNDRRRKLQKKKAQLTASPEAVEEVRVSPYNGTDVLVHPIALIRCANQTLCIQPKLQLDRTYKVYFCKHIARGVRFYFLAREGLLLHPNIHLVSAPEAADVVVYLPESAVWHKTECAAPALKAKTMVLDEGDGQSMLEPKDSPGTFLIYFKRSYVKRTNGIFKHYMSYLHDPLVFPMTYTIVEAYVRPTFNTMSKRDLDIVCTLRGLSHDPARMRVRQWVEDYAKARGIVKYVAGEVNHASRTVVSTGYLDQMFRAKIIVTANPTNWEGDFRLMEAIASGALILVDQMYVPRPYPLLNNQHVVYYDNNNKTDLFYKLDLYRSTTEHARRVAVAGYLHSMKHHRAANLIDYAFRTLHTRELGQGDTPKSASNKYTDTGFDIRENARQHSKTLKS